jgi:hypothetical protein
MTTFTGSGNELSVEIFGMNSIRSAKPFRDGNLFRQFDDPGRLESINPACSAPAGQKSKYSRSGPNISYDVSGFYLLF